MKDAWEGWGQRGFQYSGWDAWGPARWGPGKHPLGVCGEPCVAWLDLGRQELGTCIGCGPWDSAEQSWDGVDVCRQGCRMVSVLSTGVLQVKVEQMALELRLTPLTVLLRSVLDQLQDKDPARIFAQPVSLKEVGVHTDRAPCSP